MGKVVVVVVKPGGKRPLTHRCYGAGLEALQSEAHAWHHHSCQNIASGNLAQTAKQAGEGGKKPRGSPHNTVNCVSVSPPLDSCVRGSSPATSPRWRLRAGSCSASFGSLKTAQASSVCCETSLPPLNAAQRALPLGAVTERQTTPWCALGLWLPEM